MRARHALRALVVCALLLAAAPSGQTADATAPSDAPALVLLAPAGPTAPAACLNHGAAAAPERASAVCPALALPPATAPPAPAADAVSFPAAPHRAPAVRLHLALRVLLI